MEIATRLQIDQFLETLAAAGQRLLMLDYDGTLAPFQTERNKAHAYPGIGEILQEISKCGRTRVVIVSGRDVNELHQQIGLHPSPELWGLYGMQRRRPNGEVQTTRIDQTHVDALADAGRWLDYQQLRRTAEIKTGSIAAHWRGMAKSEADEMRGRVRLGWELIAARSGLELLEFDGGIEIRAPGVNKGDVVRALLVEEGAKVTAAYMGDDSSDEAAFRALGDRGLTVLARPQWRPTAARLWLRPPEEVLEFLKKWLSACREDSAKGGTAAMTMNIH